MTVMGLICIPEIYYSIQINIYGNKHKPEGYKFASFSDYWKVLVGAVVT